MMISEKILFKKVGRLVKVGELIIMEVDGVMVIDIIVFYVI